jgi:hypothetical protein
MNHAIKLQVIFKRMLNGYFNDNLIIKLASESITQHYIYSWLNNYTKADISKLETQILNLYGNDIVIDYMSYQVNSIDDLLSRAIPNLDEGFKSKMIDNFNLIETTVSKLNNIDLLDSTKITQYLDNTYKKPINLDFFKLFTQVDAMTFKQLQLLKEDPANIPVIQDTMTAFYPLFIDLKFNELSSKTILIKDLIEFNH